MRGSLQGYQGCFSSGGSLFKVGSHQGGLFLWWSLINDLSSGSTLIRMVSFQGDLLSGWNFIMVVSHQSGLFSKWSLIRLDSYQSGLSTG